MKRYSPQTFQTLQKPLCRQSITSDEDTLVEHRCLLSDRSRDEIAVASLVMYLPQENTGKNSLEPGKCRYTHDGDISPAHDFCGEPTAILITYTRLRRGRQALLQYVHRLEALLDSN